jgi:tetratricopeptide (TPR) repeat protein
MWYEKMIVSMLAVTTLVLFFGCGMFESEQELRTKALDFEKAEKFDEALAVYEQLLESFPKSEQTPETLQKIAFIYYNKHNDFAKAIECHQLLIDEYSDSRFAPQASFMIGYIYANDLKDYDVARHKYNEFLDTFKDHELVESVKWELEHLGKDVDEQLSELFENTESNGGAAVKQ